MPSLPTDGFRARAIRSLLFTLMAAIFAGGAAAQTSDQAPEAILKAYDFLSDERDSPKIGRKLKEISGLALTTDGRLLAHGDEKAVLYELGYDGSAVKSWSLTDMKKPVSDDFEGVAVADNQIYLVTSSGRLYESLEGNDGEQVLYTVYTTGVGRDCEIEGLAYDTVRGHLLLLCKDSRKHEMEGKIGIYRWSVRSKALVSNAHEFLPLGLAAKTLSGRKFEPSGIEIDPTTGHYLIIAARQHTIVELAPDGQILATVILPEDHHPQAEGITIDSSGLLIIADEGGGKRARVSFYRRALR